MKAYRNGTLSFSDGAILANLPWKHVPSAEFKGAFVSGDATTIQIMVKDSKKYASTGGRRFGRLIGSKAVDGEQHKTCFPCHEASVKGYDFVFTRFAPGTPTEPRPEVRPCTISTFLLKKDDQP